MKDRDAAGNMQMFYAFVWTFCVMLVIGVLVTYLHYGTKWQAYLIMLVIVGAVSVAAALAVQFVLAGLLDFGAFFFGKRSYRDLSEQLAGDVERIRYLKRNRHFGDALKLAEELLVKHPTSMDVKCLKTAILWEGFRRYRDAWDLLRQILQSTDRTDPNHIWAAAYYKQMCREAESKKPSKTP